MKCQFCKTEVNDKDELQIHMLNSCVEVGNNGNQLCMAAVASKDKNEVASKVKNEVHQSTGKIIQMGYKLNKKEALKKKLAACDRSEFVIEMHASCCVIVLSTAAFEMFRCDVIRYLKDCKKYMILEPENLADSEMSVTQDTIKVHSPVLEMKHLFTINLYRTTGKVMINGSDYKKFVEEDVPMIKGRIDNVKYIIKQANEQLKLCISSATDAAEMLCNKSEKRDRKKKNYDDYEMDLRKTLSLNAPKDVDHENIAITNADRDWKIRPKYWDKVEDKKEWTSEVAKECNKRKGCLMACGKNNSSEMVRCDGCGKWCHFKCLLKVVEENDDFLCYNCEEKINLCATGGREDENTEGVEEEEISGKQTSEKSSDVGQTSEDMMVPGETEVQIWEDVDVDVKEVDNDVSSEIIKSSIREPSDEIGHKNLVKNGIPTNLVQMMVTKENVEVIRPPLDSGFTSYLAELFKWYNDVDTTTYGPVVKPIGTINGTEVKSLLVNSTMDMDQVRCTEMVAGESYGPVVNPGSPVSKNALSKELLKILKGLDNGNLFSVIVKQKDKICELKMQIAEPNLPTLVVKHVNSLVKTLTEKQKKLTDLDLSSKAMKCEIAELKRLKKRYEEENAKLSKTVNVERKNTETAKQNINTLQKQIDLYRETISQLNAKVHALELAAGDLTQQQAEITPKNDEKREAKINQLNKKIDQLNKENSIIQDKLEEINKKYGNLDNHYKSIIDMKNDTISCYQEISESNDPDLRFKRLLIFHKSEKELQSMRKLKDMLLNEDKAEAVGKVTSAENPVLEATNMVESEVKVSGVGEGVGHDKKLMDFIRNGTGMADEGNTVHIPQRPCRFGKLCYRGESCKFTHEDKGSTALCRYERDCRRSDCVFQHSDDCVHRLDCSNRDCKARHIIRQGSSDKSKLMRADRRKEIDCHFKSRCNRNQCVYKHPNDCKDRESCVIPSCPMRHIERSKSQAPKSRNGNEEMAGRIDERFLCQPTYNNKQSSIIQNSFAGQQNMRESMVDSMSGSAVNFDQSTAGFQQPLTGGFPFVSQMHNFSNQHSKNVNCR